MSRVLSLTDEQRDQIARESLDHGQMLDNAFAAGVEAATATCSCDCHDNPRPAGTYLTIRLDDDNASIRPAHVTIQEKP